MIDMVTASFKLTGMGGGGAGGVVGVGCVGVVGVGAGVWPENLLNLMLIRVKCH